MVSSGIQCSNILFTMATLLALLDVSNAESGNLRGIQKQPPSGQQQQQQHRKLEEVPFSGDYSSLVSRTDTNGRPYFELQEEDTEDSSSLIGQKVYFESQAEDPGEAMWRIVGGSDSSEQRNFCMHLTWDSVNTQYVFGGCGGTLISNCHVLTAAHCSADSRSGMPDGLYCNAYNPFQGNYGRDFHFSKLSATTLHPNFDNSNNKNDVAILELENCVSDLEQFPVMGLADQAFLSSLAEGRELVVSGFGRLADDATGDQVEHLQKVAVPYITNTTCRSYYPGKIYNDMICAGRAEGGVDSCQGDSGGPLFHQGQNGDVGQTQVGIVSWGTGCAQAGKPGVYASVAYHHDWIQDIVCNNPRTDVESIALCGGGTRSVTASPTAAPTESQCAALHENCSQDFPCCGTYTCKARTLGASPTCSITTTDNRSNLANGRGGAGGASRGGN